MLLFRHFDVFYNFLCPLEMSARGNLSKLIEISKKQKIALFVIKFQCPKCSQIIPKLINLASLNVEFYKFG